MLKKLLFQTSKTPWIAYFGTWVGLSFLFLAVHFLLRLNSYGNDSETLKSNVMILQKKVGSSATLQIAKTDFDETDLELLREVSAVEAVEPVINNNFRVWLETNDRMLPVFKTDVFLQAVPSNFLDIQSPDWQWKIGDKKVPIIMPRDFLVMMNTFLSSSGMPQISDELAMQVNFKIRVSNGNQQTWYDAKIVGFTNELAALLVPKTFMDVTNNQYSQVQKSKITQLMVSSKKGKFGELEKYMNENGLEAKKAQVLIGRLKSIVSTLLLLIFAISLVALLNALFVMVQYLQLLLSRNAYNLKVLLRTGHTHTTLVRIFVTHLFIQFSILSAISLFSYFGIKILIDNIFHNGGIYINTDLSWETFLVAFVILGFFTLAVFLTARKGIRQLFHS